MKSQRYTEEEKQHFLAMAEAMQKLNESVPVSGKRYRLPLEGRDAGMVYYSAPSAHAPLILGFHGGGFLFGGCALNDAMWSAVARGLDMNVASIGYRKSPEHRFRAALEDGFDALQYLRAHAEDFGFDPRRVFAMGCSAGGNLAATLALYIREKGAEQIQGQIMIYPVLDLRTDPSEKGDGSLAQPLQYLFNDLHFRPEDAVLPILSPVYAEREELTGLPRAVIVAADHDSLKAEARRYAEMLRGAGVPAELLLAEDMPHGFFEAGFGQISDEEIEILGPEIAQKVKDGSAARTSERLLAEIRELCG
ncbi:MAG: alpha/beta hydrolase [Oscillospiraceae bacterium]|nr:alpha/beta hydrolase [Oscillospiraceae bacterium]